MSTWRLGITGGIGSGKSYVCRLLQQEYGIPVYDCDARAKALMHTDASLRAALVGLAGEETYTPAGELNRSYLAQYLFASSEHVTAVNALVHPAVKADFLSWAANAGAPLVAMESAILFESGFSDAVDAVLAVEAPFSLRLERAMSRDGATAVQVEARMRQQMTDEQRRAQADFTLLNDGKAPVPEQLHLLLTRLQSAGIKVF